MSFQEPKIVEETKPDARTYFLSAILGLLIFATVAAFYYWQQGQPITLRAERLENGLRAGSPDFDKYRDQLLVEGARATTSTRSLSNIVVELTATIKNRTGRNINGLEIRGILVDRMGSSVGERTVVMIPARQTVLKPDETVEVLIPLEGIKPDANRSNIRMEITGLKVE
jgi:hypothetical protein